VYVVATRESALERVHRDSARENDKSPSPTVNTRNGACEQTSLVMSPKPLLLANRVPASASATFEAESLDQITHDK
jgi:hypothetical protein